jgi:glycosyltransferase involved in cell wall biosynthesis
MQSTSKKIFLIVTEINFFLSHRYDLVKELANRGWKFSIVCYFDESSVKPEENIEYIFINSNRENFNIINLLLNAKKLSQKISTFKPDLIYAISHRSIFLSRLGSLFKKIDSLYAITGMGSVFTYNKNFIKRFFLKIVRSLMINSYRFFINNKNSGFILQNPDDLNFLISNRISTNKNSYIIPGNGLPDNYFSSEPPRSKNFKFIMLSRILKDKGVIEFLVAAQNIVKQYPECRFELYGSFDFNNPQSIKKNELESYLSSKITYMGYERDVKTKIVQSNILVLPSYREGFARVLMEAQACSRPVITSNISGCRDAIIENQTGLLVNPMDAKDLEEKMKYFLKNPFEYESMSKNSYNHAMTSFRIKQAADIHEDIFNKILSV